MIQLIKNKDLELINLFVFFGLIFFQSLVLIRYQTDHLYYLNLLCICLFFYLVRREIQKLHRRPIKKLELPSVLYIPLVSSASAIFVWQFLSDLGQGYSERVSQASPLYVYLAIVISFFIFSSKENLKPFNFLILLLLLAACLLAGRRMVFLLFLPCFLIFFKVSVKRLFLSFLAIIILLIFIQAYRLGTSVGAQGGLVTVAYNSFDTFHSSLILSKFNSTACGGGFLSFLSFIMHHFSIGFDPLYYSEKYECSAKYGFDLKGGGWLAHHFQWFSGIFYVPFSLFYVFLTVKTLSLIPASGRSFAIAILLMSSLRLFFYSPNAGLKPLLLIAIIFLFLRLLPMKSVLDKRHQAQAGLQKKMKEI